MLYTPFLTVDNFIAGVCGRAGRNGENAEAVLFRGETGHEATPAMKNYSL